jgi:hypothetical protein
MRNISKAALRRMEVEQKARLLAETQQMLEEARREFELQGPVNYEETPGRPSILQEFLTAEKNRNELIAMERQQKAELLKNMREANKAEYGVEWPVTHDYPEASRYDHIPKHPEFLRHLIEGRTFWPENPSTATGK